MYRIQLYLKTTTNNVLALMFLRFVSIAVFLCHCLSFSHLFHFTCNHIWLLSFFQFYLCLLTPLTPPPPPKDKWGEKRKEEEDFLYIFQTKQQQQITVAQWFVSPTLVQQCHTSASDRGCLYLHASFHFNFPTHWMPAERIRRA